MNFYQKCVKNHYSSEQELAIAIEDRVGSLVGIGIECSEKIAKAKDAVRSNAL